MEKAQLKIDQFESTEQRESNDSQKDHQEHRIQSAPEIQEFNPKTNMVKNH